MSDPKPNLIGGAWRPGEGAPNVSPSDLSLTLGEYARGTRADALDAIAAAKAAFPAWSRSAPLTRHAILRKAADEILARREELGRLRPWKRARPCPKASGK